MTKKERNTYLILGAVGVGAFYLINKQNQERKQRELIRMQQLQARQNRGGCRVLGNLIGTIGDLIQNRRDRKANKGAPMKGSGAVTLPNVDLSNVSATLGNITGGGNGLNMDDPFGVGTLNVPDLPDFNFDNP